MDIYIELVESYPQVERKLVKFDTDNLRKSVDVFEGWTDEEVKSFLIKEKGQIDSGDLMFDTVMDIPDGSSESVSHPDYSKNGECWLNVFSNLKEWKAAESTEVTRSDCLGIAEWAIQKENVDPEDSEGIDSALENLLDEMETYKLPDKVKTKDCDIPFQIKKSIEAMRKYGEPFEKSLAYTLLFANSEDYDKLTEAFSHYIEHYRTTAARIMLEEKNVADMGLWVAEDRKEEKKNERL